METKQVTVQPAVGGMIKASKDSFVIPKEELKDFYLIQFEPSIIKYKLFNDQHDKH